MSEKELLELGFIKEYGSETGLEDAPDFYYYVKEITNELIDEGYEEQD